MAPLYIAILVFAVAMAVNMASKMNLDGMSQWIPPQSHDQHTHPD